MLWLSVRTVIDSHIMANHAVNSDVPGKIFVPVGVAGGTPVTWFR